MGRIPKINMDFGDNQSFQSLFQGITRDLGMINFESQIVSEHFLDQPLWYNCLIRINSKPVNKVRHLLRDDNISFLSLK